MVNIINKLLLAILLLSSTVYAETIMIKNAKIHTLGTQGTLNNGAILIEDGKVSMVGIGIPADNNTTVIDAQGKVVTPGLMNANTSLGLVEVSAIKSTVDTSTSEKGYSASFSIADAINPNSSLMAHNRINGLTRAMVTPSSDNTLFSGSGSLIKLSQVMQPVTVADNAIYMTYGSTGAKIAGGSRAVALFQIKEIFMDLLAYKDNPKESKAESSLKKRDLKALLPMLNGIFLWSFLCTVPVTFFRCSHYRSNTL